MPPHAATANDCCDQESFASEAAEVEATPVAAGPSESPSMGEEASCETTLHLKALSLESWARNLRDVPVGKAWECQALSCHTENRVV